MIKYFGFPFKNCTRALYTDYEIITLIFLLLPTITHTKLLKVLNSIRHIFQKYLPIKVIFCNT